MAAPMRSTDFRSIVEPILNECFDGVYDQRADEWSRVFREQTGIPRNYHEEPVLYGFGAAPQLPDGSPVTYQQGGVLFLKRYVYSVYGLAFALTKVLVEDGDHIRIGSVYARHLAQSLVETKETLCANVLNNAFTGGQYAGGDGVATVDADAPALEVLGVADPGLGVDQDRAVVEGAHQEDRQRGEALAVRSRADVGRQRHLADVEFHPAHHAAEGVDQHRDFLEREVEAHGPDGAVLQGAVAPLGAGDGPEGRDGHARLSVVQVAVGGRWSSVGLARAGVSSTRDRRPGPRSAPHASTTAAGRRA